ncbi:isopentenyl-diphosphate Delta-isomerase [Candidatus Woesearchaeota archaeon]|nr:isopentenyl-diphosphate Delta-isomerase [Candidatus Woesearchaeota archaeon]
MLMQQVILVNESDQQIGIEEKLKAHQLGLLHRAFSIFIFNKKKELLLQQRARTKYHSPLLWTNTCCSHPMPGESTAQAAHRRLHEELGFDCNLKESFTFLYKTEFDNGLIEHEFDHVFIGYYDQQIVPNKQEIESVKWISLENLKDDIQKNQEKYSYWLRQCFSKLII